MRTEYKKICEWCKRKYKDYRTKSRFCSLRCFGKSGLGRKLSDVARMNIGIAKMAERNPMWKGDNVGYGKLHEWVKRRKEKTKWCHDCRKEPPRDLANKGIYDRQLKNWEWLCRRCHMKKDGRLEIFIHSKRNSKTPWKTK